MKKNVLLPMFLIVIMLINSLSAQNVRNRNILPGSWLGKLSTNGIDLRLVFNLKLNHRDSLAATLDSTDHGAKDILLGKVISDDKKLTIPAIEKALKSSGNKSSKTVKITGLNHLFQHCKTGLPSEYGTIEETFSPEALKIISDWILAL
jgi:hypothetical protein